MGESVSKGVFFNNPSFEQFCLLVFNTKSNKILNLMKFLIGMNIDNIDKLFDENGMTNYLFSYLAFDPDYILYCINNGIDLVNKIEAKMKKQKQKMKEQRNVQRQYIPDDYVEEYVDEDEPQEEPEYRYYSRYGARRRIDLRNFG